MGVSPELIALQPPPSTKYSYYRKDIDISKAKYHLECTAHDASKREAMCLLEPQHAFHGVTISDQRSYML